MVKGGILSKGEFWSEFPRGLVVVVVLAVGVVVGGVSREHSARTKTIRVQVYDPSNPLGDLNGNGVIDRWEFNEVAIAWATPLIIYATFVFAPAPFVLLFYISRVLFNIAQNFVPPEFIE